MDTLENNLEHLEHTKTDKNLHNFQKTNTYSSNEILEDDENKSIKSINKQNIEYYCKICEFKTSVKCNYNKHLITNVHLNNVKFICNICLKRFKSRSGIWNHKQKCNSSLKINMNQSTELSTFIGDNIRQNLEEFFSQDNEFITKFITDTFKNNNLVPCNTVNEIQNQQITHVENATIQNQPITNNIQNQQNNYQVQINYFLDNVCKDAVSFYDFANTNIINYADIVNARETNGLTNVICNKIVNNLKNMDITKRPIHCTNKLSIPPDVYIKVFDNVTKKYIWVNNSVLLMEIINAIFINKNREEFFRWENKFQSNILSKSKKEINIHTILQKSIPQEDSENALHMHNLIINKAYIHRKDVNQLVDTYKTNH